MSSLLLDASVWIASLDPLDPHHAEAQQLIVGVESGRSLAALDLTLYEVANVAVKSWKAPEDAGALVELVRSSCPGTLAPVDEELIEQAIALADEHGLTVYDAAYVAAAKLHDWTLVSADHADLVRPGLAVTPDAALKRSA
jgi:predicted nucleic acid-binding protein